MGNDLFLRLLPSIVYEITRSESGKKCIDILRGRAVMPDWPTAEDLGNYIAKLCTGKAPGLEQTIHKIYTVDDI